VQLAYSAETSGHYITSTGKINWFCQFMVSRYHVYDIVCLSSFWHFM